MSLLQNTRSLTPLELPFAPARVPAGARWWLALGAVFCFHLVLSAVMPAADDELYYWYWSRHLAGSYFDHPPLVAYAIRFSTAIFGNSVLAIRLPACLLALLTMALIGRMGGRRSLLYGLLVCPIYLLGSILITPDAPLVAAWALYLAWLLTVSDRMNRWNDDPVARVYRQSPITGLQWILGGIALGLGGLSKYTMVLAVPCSFLVLLTQARWRAWIRGYALHLAAALILVSPVFFFNVAHHFEPLQFQWTHASSPVPIGGGLLGFMASQWVLVGFLPFVLLPWILICLPELLQNPRWRVFAFFFLLPLAFVLVQAARHGSEANWGLPAYLAFWPLAQHLLSTTSFPQIARGIAVFGFLPAWATTLVAGFHFFISPLPWLTPEKDRMAQYAAKAQVAHEAIDFLRDHQPLRPVYAASYQWASQLAFAGATTYQIPHYHRDSQFTYLSPDPCASPETIVFRELGEQFTALACFPSQTVLARFPMIVRKKRLHEFELVRYARAVGR